MSYLFENAFKELKKIDEGLLDFALEDDPDWYVYDGQDIPKEVKKSITKVRVKDEVTVIAAHAFERCIKLKQVIIPSSVTIIGPYAFHNCKNLPEITIPSSVVEIDRWAFTYCENLKKISIPSGVATINTRAFADCKSLEKVIIPNSVTEIDDRGFQGCTHLKSIIYLGTNAQWDNIQKDLDWDDNTGDYLIHCTDEVLVKGE